MDFENLVFVDIDRVHDTHTPLALHSTTELDIQQRNNPPITTATTTRILRARRTIPSTSPSSSNSEIEVDSSIPTINTTPLVNTPVLSSSPSSSSSSSSSAPVGPTSISVVEAETISKNTVPIPIPTKLNKDKRLTLPSSPTGLDITDFECALCIQIYHQPVTTSCGHVFCRQCIVRASRHCPNCPLCRHPLESKFAVNVVLMNVVEKYFPKEHQERVCESGELEIIPRVLNKVVDEQQDEPQNTWGCLIPSLRSTCTVFLSCGGF